MSTDVKNSPKNAPAEESAINHNAGSYQAVKAPIITEKTYRVSQKNQYTFSVAKDSNKTEIKKAVEGLYNVKVSQVRVIRMKPERTFVRGIRGTIAGYKKAVVTLQEGFSINI